MTNQIKQLEKCDLPKNEEAMMKEIFKNGPIIVNLQAVEDLYDYRGGTYIPYEDTQSLAIEFL